MKRFLIGVLILLSGLLPLSAQDLTETFTFENGTSFAYPADSEINEEEPGLMIVTLEDDGEIWVASMNALTEAADLDDAELVDVMSVWVVFLLGAKFEFDEADFETIEVGDAEALSFAYVVGEGAGGLALVIEFADGTFGVINGVGDVETIDVTLAVAESFGPVEAETTGGTACTVSTGDANTVQLRVGPGINRTVYAFLPPHVDFTPLGSTEADDGSIWFQLDKAEAAPNAAAAEAWVAADAVDAEGDCANIGEASAPPIIPIVPQAAPPADSGGGDSDNSSSEGGSQSSGGSIAPVPGTWTITYAARGKASCLDISGTFDFSPGWSSDVVNLSVSGSSVIMDGNRFSQIQPGVYSGTFTLSNGNALQFIIRPVAPTQFTGEALLTGVVEGHTCSNTVPLTITRN